jgi:hypothetical protein
MFSLGESAPEATSTPTQRKVVSRTLVWSGGVVEMEIPKECRSGSYDEGDKKVDFIQFAKKVKTQGFRTGRVNVFVRAPNPEQYAGTTIKASVEIYCKEFDEGSKFLHVDLVPTDAVVTHWLTVEKDSRTYTAPCIESFRTPAPLDGKIVLTKILSKKTAADKPAAKSVSTGDKQLDRLLGQGWTIARDDAKCVHLTKGEGDNAKTMVHHRTKSKKK